MGNRKEKALNKLLAFDGILVILYLLACAFVKSAPEASVITACIAAAGTATFAFMLGNGMEHIGNKE